MRIRCQNIYSANGIMAGVLHINQGHIVKIDDYSTEYDYDAGGLRMLPGIIDIHTHGFMSYASQCLDVENFRFLQKAMASQGVTGFLVTAGEHNDQDIEELQTIAQAIDNNYPGAKILGIHMEGPFLNNEKKGAFMYEQLLPLSIEQFKLYQEAAKGHIKYVAYSPELDIDFKFLEYLKEKNIRSAGAHTYATYDVYQRAIQNGLNASTHTGNGMRQIDRREVGALGAALLEQNFYNEMICDLIHLSKEMLEIYFRMKSKNRLLMISDSGQLSGLPCGKYRIHNQNRIIHNDGRITLEDGGIAGSSKSILWGIQCLEKKMHINMENILLMCSKNQAEFLGLNENIGSIDVNKDADFFLIDENYQVIKTFVKGEEVYDINDQPLPFNYSRIQKLL